MSQIRHIPLQYELSFSRLTGHDNDEDPSKPSPVTCAEWSKKDWKIATCADDFTHRIWRIQDYANSDFCHENDISKCYGKTCEKDAHILDSEICKGRAEKLDNVQFPVKSDIKVTNFYEKAPKLKENSQECFDNDSDLELSNRPICKKRRILSPLNSNETQVRSPQNRKMLSNLPCSWDLLTSPRKTEKSPRKILISPRKLAISPRKLAISPQILFSPTANLPNLKVDGRSPHQLNCSGKKQAKVDWLTSLRRSKTEETPNRKASIKRKRAKKSLNMNV